jgi:hypothetical protein
MLFLRDTKNDSKKLPILEILSSHTYVGKVLLTKLGPGWRLWALIPHNMKSGSIMGSRLKHSRFNPDFATS